jgi:precorrin-6B C5,15-methyltransferase / cobalt-precorrin-6B C5,C15-methyltransferase
MRDLENCNLDPQDWEPPLVVLVGVGMGKEDLSLRMLSWIQRAQILVGSRRVLEYCTDHQGEKYAFGSSMEGTLQDVLPRSEKRRTLVLASGDPLFYGVGRRLVRLLGKERLIVLPNITSVQALFAKMAEPWEDVRILSLHGRSGSNWLGELRRHTRLAVFTDPQHTPAWIAQELLSAGVTDRCLVVGEDLGSSKERVQRLSLEEASGRSFSPLNLTAILPSSFLQSTLTHHQKLCAVGAASSRDANREAPPTADALSCEVRRSSAAEQLPSTALPLLGLSDGVFQHQAGLITKMEVRAVVLAHLQLMADQVLWDVGAGSGSVAVEAARLAPLRHVAAMEKDPGRYADLVENVKRFCCGEIQTVQGTAPQALRDLPDPDRVFLGGSGGNLVAILQAVAERLRPGGRVVHTVVTLDSLEQIRSFWHGRAVDLSVTQLQVSRSLPIGGSLRLEALNPVFIITVQSHLESSSR